MSDNTIEHRLEAAAEAAVKFKAEYKALLKSGLDEKDLKERLDAAEDLIKTRDARTAQSLRTRKAVKRF